MSLARMTDRQVLRELRALQQKVERTSEARRLLEPGSSRARVTTANARWMTACEARDRYLAEAQARGLVDATWSLSSPSRWGLT